MLLLTNVLNFSVACTLCLFGLRSNLIKMADVAAVCRSADDESDFRDVRHTFVMSIHQGRTCYSFHVEKNKFNWFKF